MIRQVKGKEIREHTNFTCEIRDARESSLSTQKPTLIIDL